MAEKLWVLESKLVLNQLEHMQLTDLVKRGKGCTNVSLKSAIYAGNQIGVLDYLRMIPIDPLMLFARVHAVDQLRDLIVLRAGIEAARDAIYKSLHESHPTVGWDKQRKSVSISR